MPTQQQLKIFLLILAFIAISLPFTKIAFAAAAEDLYPTIYDQAMRERNGISVSNVKSSNGVVTYDARQDVIVGGSKHSITQKNIPLNAANDPFYKKTAGFAKNLLKGGAVGIAASLAMQNLLDGVGYLIDSSGQIKYKVDPNGFADSTVATAYRLVSSEFPNQAYYFNDTTSLCRFYASKIGVIYVSTGYNFCTLKTSSNSLPYNATVVPTSKVANPNYVPNSTPQKTPVPDAAIDDAFSNWMKNNPGSVVDPVVTYIYSPKDSSGNVVASTTSDHPSFGQNEINDEMMNNYINNYKESLANDQYWKDKINSSTEPETVSDPSGSKTSITNNPDGSTTTKTTNTVLDPDTGIVTTTISETTVMPDGTTSTKTETISESSLKPDTTKLPLMCDYFASLCEWLNWTKDVPDLHDQPLEIQDQPIIDYGFQRHVTFGSSCPFSPSTQNFDMGILGVMTFDTDVTFICTFATDARPYIISLGHLGALLYLIFALRSGNA